MDNVRTSVEWQAREAYSRLVAWLASRTRDLAAAEDALGDAFLAALETWPQTGIPDRPGSWLLTTARRRLIDQSRRAATHAKMLDQFLHEAAVIDEEPDCNAVPDDRLNLLFVCAHPAIEESMRTPLMLQTVLGLDAERIASAFLVSPAAMRQRLTRVKTKIRDAGIPFEVPETAARVARQQAVRDAIYAAYNAAWDDAQSSPLVTEALHLAAMLVELSPADAESHGLLALLLYCESRRHARRDEAGFVPLAQQDVGGWDHAMIDQAERHLRQAGALGNPGRFQWEAAIQAVHAGRRRNGVTRWDAIIDLYEQLLAHAPTLGAYVGYAAALGEGGRAAEGLAVLDALPAERVAQYQPYWATRAHLLGRADRLEEARRAFDCAVGLCADPAVRAYLLGQTGLCVGMLMG